MIRKRVIRCVFFIVSFIKADEFELVSRDGRLGSNGEVLIAAIIEPSGDDGSAADERNGEFGEEGTAIHGDHSVDTK
ncbi:hypothetical protein [Haladaptatus halobius]|uniref:hypothetical protein n=1 Tax=Haladaptatus halobius TaxID=2884875 RepID=UPI001D0B23EB|nr:hypothetical protein [Haladaptatus halobius]